jgi:hypothetical protein
MAGASRLSDHRFAGGPLAKEASATCETVDSFAAATDMAGASRLSDHRFAGGPLAKEASATCETVDSFAAATDIVAEHEQRGG